MPAISCIPADGPGYPTPSICRPFFLYVLLLGAGGSIGFLRGTSVASIGVEVVGILLALSCKSVKIKSAHLAYGRVDFLVSSSASHVWFAQGTTVLRVGFRIGFYNY